MSLFKALNEVFEAGIAEMGINIRFGVAIVKTTIWIAIIPVSIASLFVLIIQYLYLKLRERK